MRSVVIPCILFLWGWSALQGQSVLIYGQDAAYGGKSIQIYMDHNPFIELPQFAETVLCGADGSFKHEFEIGSRQVIQIETGVYRAYFYVEPDCSYEIELPVYRELSYAESISPFFQHLNVPLKVLSCVSPLTGMEKNLKTDLNFKIARFDSVFAATNDRVIMNRRLGRISKVDSIIHVIDAEYKSDTSHFFEDYRRYKYGALKLNEGRTGLEEISIHYLGPDVHHSHPGFLELFSAMYKEFLFYYSRTHPGERLMRHINRTQNLDSVRYSLRRHPAVWNDTLADMILLQELPTLFYDGSFHKEAILILLKSLEEKAVTAEFSAYASQLNSRLSSMMVGHQPPHFSLPDLTGNRYSLEDFQGKYVYLMFCTPDHYGCMMEYPYLQSYHQKHAEYLAVVTVMVADDESSLQDFMSRNGYGWKTLFFDDQSELLSDYFVKAYPTAYLIGPDGNLILSPSSLPTDGFEQQLFRIMRSRGDI